MSRLAALLAVGVLCFANSVQADDVSFVAFDIFLESAEPVAAWQFELGDRNESMQVVGVEGGDSDSFRAAPYFDREAVQQGKADRIVVADYSLAATSELPSGRIRIATVHLMLDSSAKQEFELNLVTATTHDGRVIDASISLTTQTGSEL